MPDEPDDPRETDEPLETDGNPVDHLWNAAHEMLRAFRTLIDAADEFVESQRGHSVRADPDRQPREGRVQPITIDSSDAGVA